MKMSTVTLASVVTALTLLSAPLLAEPIPDEVRVGGFAVGCQAYSFNRFSVFEAIEKTEQTGARTIEFYPGQKLSKEEPGVKWSHDAPDDVVAKVQEKLAKHGIRAVNYGVVDIPKDEAAARKVFEFAKRMKLYAVTTESIGSLDTIEKLVKEYDIRCAIHEHAKNPSRPEYRIWDPKYVLELVKDRDSRIGACADIGHWQTSGIAALDGIKILAGRIISLHMKDRAALGPGQHDCIFGTGTANIGAILRELRRQEFAGNISIEYEYNWDNSVPDIAQCVGFVRGWGSRGGRNAGGNEEGGGGRRPPR